MLDNHQLTVGHELIMLDAELCIPWCYKKVWRTKTNTGKVRYQKHTRGVQTTSLVAGRTCQVISL